ncbi:ribbon-helix-helix protein, CopG family [Saccharolobus islandicus]|nr:ribbon-helix-helix protein, CopG family [Sulfolobus islandicus]
MRIVTFKLEEELLQQLDLYCINNAKERSEVIRTAIKFYLSCRKGRIYRLNSFEEKNNGVRVREI